MFAKKQFKVFLDVPTLSQDNNDLASLSIESHSSTGEWIFQFENSQLVLKKKIVDTFPVIEDCCIKVNANEILDIISGVHGVQQIFDIQKGQLKVYKKKTMEEIKTIELNYEDISPLIFSTNENLSHIDDSLPDMLGALKRYLCKLEYFTGFNNYSLLSDNSGIIIFGTDGLHSLSVRLTKESQVKSSYFLTPYQVQYLKNFIVCEGNEYKFEMKDNKLLVSSLDSTLELTLQKNDELDSVDLLYPRLSKEGVDFPQDTRNKILEYITREEIKSYKETHKAKESYEVFLEFSENIKFNDNVIEKNPLDTFKRRVCVYHIIEYLKGIKGECSLHPDRLETNNYILYF